ncbi:MAG: hypothetical protein LBL19_05160 [Spirochaetaceae bacterium]|nr:hypothetical protein [Spirochaetaceae bacterium]
MGETGEGRLTISLNGAGRVAAPDTLPKFESVRVIIFKDGTPVDTGKIDGPYGSYTVSLPAGEVYRVELDALVDEPEPILGRRYGGGRDVEVSEGSATIKVNLSVTETALLGINAPELSIYQDTGVTVEKKEAITGLTGLTSKVFFDRYGRLFYLDDNCRDLWMLADTRTGFSQVFTAGSPLTDVAYLKGALYFCTDSRFAALDLEDLEPGRSLTFTPFSPLVDTGLAKGVLLSTAGGDSLYVAVNSIDGNSIRRTDTEGVQEAVSALLPGVPTGISVIEGTLYVLTAENGSYRLIAYRDTPRLLEPVAVSLALSPADYAAAIAGGGKDAVYVYYRGNDSGDEGIVKLSPDDFGPENEPEAEDDGTPVADGGDF